MLFYQENPVRKDNQGRLIFRGKSVPYDDQDACGAWAGHYANCLVLTKMTRDSSLSLTERRAAEGELRICERKMAHWEKHRNWDAAICARAAQELKRAAR